ncbi:hypothetical protein D6C91_06450 [Aureobasidium pullulans]|uniref:DH domain-containing protein n=1 Tax=Aureobasidium pullulans TaxID=5580 RepID=A0A4S9SWB6_AURPU|nr:hypothetical protein D6C91_06450 [Aureobasidium pullulans]
MAYSPLGTPYDQRSYERSWSSLGSTGTVHRRRSRQLSVGSLASAASLYNTPWRSASNHGTPLRSTSYSDLEKGTTPAAPSPPIIASNISRSLSVPPAVPQLVTTTTTPLPSPVESDPLLATPAKRTEYSALDLVDEERADWDEEDHALLESETYDSSAPHLEPPVNFDCVETSSSSLHQPFSRWMNTLRMKKASYKRHIRPKLDALMIPQASQSVVTSPDPSIRGHRKSGSWASSVNFITAVKSATMTVASASIAPLSRSASKRSSHPRLYRGSSGLFDSEPRFSTESGRPSLSLIIDDAARQRAKKRREKIEELIKTEESYLSDLKALSNAYFTFLPPTSPFPSVQVRASARSNITNMLQLHTELLEDLHRVVPFSEHDQTITDDSTPKRKPLHVRWHSEDSIPVRRPPLGTSHTGWSNRYSLDSHRAPSQEPLPLTCTPATAADIGRIFAKNVSVYNHLQGTIKRFALYEEYSARCESMHDDIDFTQRTSFSVWDYDKAIETLSASVNPIKSREANRRKALSIKDLLIKPIQRITRYELLFKDLCRLTPSCDDPNSHAVLDDVLYRLGETCRNVDESRDNPDKLRLMENSWILQDRLCFSDKLPRELLFQRLGRLSLCGTLYVAYRNKTKFNGCYMICVLYESCLLLALADRNSSKYKVVVGTSLASTSIEESDNGKGLQCHTAPFTWKVVFESGGKMYELILGACSEAEESVWRDRLAGRIAVEAQHVAEGHIVPIDLQSPLTRELRSIGKAYGKARGFVRRLSIQRTATLGPMIDSNQVIIMHTSAPKDDMTNASTSSLPGRSKSLPTTSGVPILAPMRAERIKVETAMYDVWTKDSIPYPGMGSRRTENIFKDTANDLLRKLSMASIASNFSRRSMSYTSIRNSHAPTEKLVKAKPIQRPDAVKPKRPPLVNFQNAPDAFLPEDFELQGPDSKRSRRLGLRTLTMTDRPRSPFFFSENKAPELKRAKSTTQARAPTDGEVKAETVDESGRKDSLQVLQSKAGNTVAGAARNEAKVVETDATRKKRPRLLRYLTSKSRVGDERVG